MATQNNAPITFVVPGQREASRGASIAAPVSTGLPGTLKASVRVSSSRRSTLTQISTYCRCALRT